MVWCRKTNVSCGITQPLLTILFPHSLVAVSTRVDNKCLDLNHPQLEDKAEKSHMIMPDTAPAVLDEAAEELYGKEVSCTTC